MIIFDILPQGSDSRICPRRVLTQRPTPEEAPKESPGVYIQGQRIFVDKVRNVFVMGEAFSI